MKLEKTSIKYHGDRSFHKNTHPTKKNVNLLVCLLVYIYLCGALNKNMLNN